MAQVLIESSGTFTETSVLAVLLSSCTSFDVCSTCTILAKVPIALPLAPNTPSPVGPVTNANAITFQLYVNGAKTSQYPPPVEGSCTQDLGEGTYFVVSATSNNELIVVTKTSPGGVPVRSGQGDRTPPPQSAVTVRCCSQC